MTLPRADVRHATRSRLRLGIPDRRGDEAWFRDVAETLDGVEFVQEVRVNPLAASVLVVHDARREDVAEAARREGLFEVAPPPKAEPLLSALNRSFRRADDGLRRISEGRLDINALGLFVFVGGGMLQIFRGNYLPAGVSMLWSAKNLVAHAEQVPEPDLDEGDDDDAM